MKLVILILLLFFSSFLLFSDEIPLEKELTPSIKELKFPNIEFYVSPGVIADVGIGAAQRFELESSYQEATLLIHADLFPHVWEENIDEFYKIYFWGAKFKSSYFYKPDYSGFNWFFNIGFQAIYIDLAFLECFFSFVKIYLVWFFRIDQLCCSELEDIQVFLFGKEFDLTIFKVIFHELDQTNLLLTP